MQDVEMILYNYMLQGINTPRSEFALKLINMAMTSINVSVFDGLVAWVTGKRMSGEMCTSLGNGFTNLIILSYITSCRGGELVAVVEGDDSLFSTRGCVIDDQDFTDMGMIAKREKHRHIGLASFCGNVFHPDVQDIIADPIYSMCRLPVLNQRYCESNNNTKMQLLRSKALSLAHQYPGCPILDTLSKRLLTLTSNHTVGERIIRNMHSYKREEYKRDVHGDIPNRPIDDRTRLLMAEAFGVSVATQLLLEKQIAVMTLDDTGDIWKLMPTPWVKNYLNHVSHEVRPQPTNPIPRAPVHAPDCEVPTGKELREGRIHAERRTRDIFHDAISW